MSRVGARGSYSFFSAQIEYHDVIPPSASFGAKSAQSIQNFVYLLDIIKNTRYLWFCLAFPVSADNKEKYLDINFESEMDGEFYVDRTKFHRRKRGHHGLRIMTARRRSDLS
jgi:hypothetical protein